MFAKVVVDLGYRKFYRRRNETRMVKKKSDEPGWYTTAVTKKILLGDYARALRTGAFINPSAEAIKECREYVHHTTGDIVHSHAATSYDPTQRGDNHGDIVIADALAWRGSQEISKPQSRPPVSKLTELSFAGRQEILRQKAVGNSIMDNFVCSW